MRQSQIWFRPAFTVIFIAALIGSGAFATTDSAQAQSPYPPLRGYVANGTDIAISEARINSEFQERLAEPYGLDGIVLLVEDCRPDPEVYLDGAMPHYGLSAGPGLLNDDVIAIFVCEDPRFVGAFWDADNTFADRLDDDAIANAMIPNLQAGNFTGAVTAGIDTVVADIDRAIAPAAPAAPAIPQAVADSGSSGGFGPAGIALIAAVGAGAYFLLRRRGRTNNQDETTPEADELQPVKDLDLALNELRSTLTPSSPALAHLIHLYEPLGDDAMLALHERHGTMLKRLSSLEQQAASLVRGKQADPESGDPEVRRRYAEALAEANTLREYAHGLRQEADHAKRLVERAAVLTTEARKAIAAAGATYSAFRSGNDTIAGPVVGDLPEAATALAVPTHLVERAEAALAAGERLRAGELGEDARLAAEQVARFTTELPAVEMLIDDAALAFTRLDAYAPASWADIRGNGSEAEESVAAALEVYRRVLRTAPQDFGHDVADGFGASLQVAYTELARARSLAEAVIERRANIEQARTESASLLSSISTSIDEARALLARPDVDREVGPAPEQSLDHAQSLLDDARSTMTVVPTDWMLVRGRLMAANQAVDDALAAAKAEQQRMATMRRQVDSTREEATAAIARAERYIAAHRGDLGPTSISPLPDARDLQRRATQAEESAKSLAEEALTAALRQSADLWSRARDRATEAYELAAADVARAEERRRQYQPRPTWIGPEVPMPSRRRSWPMSGPPFGGMGGFGGSGSSPSPARRSSWGSTGGGSSGPSVGGSSRSSGGGSSRRGGGKGW